MNLADDLTIFNQHVSEEGEGEYWANRIIVESFLKLVVVKEELNWAELKSFTLTSTISKNNQFFLQQVLKSLPITNHTLSK
jgi:hypothetical protein